MKRRTFLLAGAAATLPLRALANTEPVIKVLKTPTCGCCTAWVDHVRQAGFAVEAQDVDQDALYAFKDRLQIAPELAGCHTAVVGDYFIEGHVPAGDIFKLLTEKPNARGLSVPAMPIGSPGMEMGNNKEPFDTLLVFENGKTRVFNSHAHQSST